VESLELANQIADVIVDKQGEDILILDLTEVTTFADFFVICTAGSRRQLDALENAVQAELKKLSPPLLARNVEGEPDSGWILVDYNSVIIHLFTDDVRDYYRLEDLWGNARIVARIQ
jgi:ribosome-associated protein